VNLIHAAAKKFICAAKLAASSLHQMAGWATRLAENVSHVPASDKLAKSETGIR